MKETKYYCDICRAEIKLEHKTHFIMSNTLIQGLQIQMTDQRKVLFQIFDQTDRAWADGDYCPICIAEAYVKQKKEGK